MTKPFYTLAEVAQREGISTRRLRILCEEGRVFYAQKAGNVWLVQLNYWIDRKKVGRPKNVIPRWHPQAKSGSTKK